MKRNKRKNLIKRFRRNRVRAKIFGTQGRPRVTIFRSNKFVYVQLIDDQKGATVISAANKKGVKSAQSLGEKIVELAKKANIKEMVLDRGVYKYHGQIKAVAEAIRASGIKL